MKFNKLSRIAAFSYDGQNIKRASDHADLLECYETEIENIQDSDEDPRELFPSSVIIGVEYETENGLVYEIVGNILEENIINRFLNNVSKELYIWDYNSCSLELYKRKN